ncbi:N-acetyltransferase [Fundicoccus culcitae]|uniref:N-acetyltransferase n=1 Tax=Fundicoccus culcitae TaxID=2969821 RepID=A0ABY5P2G9_9LACT|nr:N-acetyltransferase [Fundicoccus culcitae]UUX32839.1 N-acetyltransferase [Fundicoccus culcitae]
MYIRKTRPEEAETVATIFDHGRSIQRATGNHDQWNNGYPNVAVVLDDIAKNESYVCVSDATELDLFPTETLLATFCLQKGIDPTYVNIDGAWLNEEPYVTIHRVSTNGKLKGVGRQAIEWVMQHNDNIRIDTHEKNTPMRRLVDSLGFTYCGIIYLADGSPRLAYQFLNPLK